ncbi:hypothetical protein M3Y94_00068400 [Aphelenchoides besseyi]|nr:hypothetical protein M3Y94_00068400 [Aphelenchoides besseyi]KAI6237893.1 hypothetical protein M3Y95_00312600 [Aphelenchoides besseyi]
MANLSSKTWIQKEILHTVVNQKPEVHLRNVVVVGDANVVSEIGTDVRSYFNDTTTVEFVDLVGLQELKVQTQQLVFVYKQLVKHTSDVDRLLEGTSRVLQENGIAVIYEQMDTLTTKSIADFSTSFDSYNKEIDGVNTNLKVYCMNQFEENDSGELSVYWILERTSENVNDENNKKMTGSWLDQTQYTEENIEAYEWIFGRDFISPGGVDENRRFLSQFDGLAAGKTMLDIGCGIGGGPRQAARELGLQVLGCDISANMVAFAIARSIQEPDRRVRYQLTDAVQYRYERESFDYAYSRDCVQHISELACLFANIYNSLKPGGQFIVTLYGKGQGKLTDEFLEYVKDRRYDLRSLDEVIKMVRTVGFQNVEGENITPRFEEILKKERQKAIDNRDEFMERFTVKKYESLLSGWEQKLRFIREDNHNWLKIKCTK